MNAILSPLRSTVAGRSQVELLAPLRWVLITALAATLFGGLIAALCDAGWRTVGLLLTWLASAGTAGMFLGFLFGIPRSGSDSLPYINNTNLEDISDWLTKIIVGATLVEIRPLAERLWALALEIDVLGDRTPAGATLVIGIAATALVAGFIWTYLWTRNELKLMLINVDQQAKEVVATQIRGRTRKVKKVAFARPGESAKANDVGRAEASADSSVDAGRPDKAVSTAPSPDPWNTAGMSPEEVFASDPNKDKFGGLPENRKKHRKLSASWEPPSAADEYLVVCLWVESTDPAAWPLRGNVRFYLHPTFRLSLIDQQADGVKAATYIELMEAFTVGAECDNGATRLELDLATLPDFPSRFLPGNG